MDLAILGVIASIALILVAGVVYVALSQKPKIVLSKEKWINMTLTSKKQISPDTAVYKFDFGAPKATLGLPCGQVGTFAILHVQLKASIDGKDVTRSYTPISSPSTEGYCEFVIKAYDAGVMSKYVDKLKIGDTILARGPKGSFVYTPNAFSEIIMLAGGTGITPMYQVIEAIVTNPKDATKIKLIYANRTEGDILMRKELESFTAISKNLQIHYVVEKTSLTIDVMKATPGWTGSVGYITLDVIKALSPSPDAKILLCGPPPMISKMTELCEVLGYPKARTVSKPIDQVFKF
ncbi:NADH-cytochrome b5 reductase [Phlyctochytrium planicorne]|nr:NADH-cytochrome b5 reductase [Phlyctochytrium planicorne]